MTPELRWATADELDTVALTRLRCYAGAAKELDSMKERLLAEGRAKVGDYLLAFRDGQPVGTTTSLSLTMWVRGAPLPCQGVAWVGAVKTERRRGAAPGTTDAAPGVATLVMRETLRKARERGEVLSALMPFRASFYEKFGYGLAERPVDWTLPMAVLPVGDCAGMRFHAPEDVPAMHACRQRTVARGQCDIERPLHAWDRYLKWFDNGFVVVDPDPAGPGLRGWLAFENVQEGTKDGVRVNEIYFDTPAVLRRQLCFLATLRDQYAHAVLTLPADLPLNHLLRESQVPHRPVNHAHAEARPYTRMQVRVLDHRRFLEALLLPAHLRGMCTVAIRETEGDVCRLRLDLSDGHVTVAPATADPDLAITDRTWASIVTGDLPIRFAIEHGLVACSSPAALPLLEAFAAGPAPFCRDFF